MGTIRFFLNGKGVVLDDPAPQRTLLDWLRRDARLTGTKEGCNEGDCGACTVTVSALENGSVVHRALNACILFLPQLHGKSVRTVEGISGPGGALHPVQHAMIDHHGSQCGFCTPGVVMSLYTAFRDGRRDFDNVLAGNLCRCTGYAPILRAAEASADLPAPDWELDEAALLANASGDGDLEGGCASLPGDLDRFAEWFEQNPDATLIAGATDVGLWVTKQFRDLGKVAFLHRLEALQGIETGQTHITVGAGVSLARLRGVLAGPHPDLEELVRRYGSVQVRNAATVGGNIANGSPVGDMPPALIALGATLVLRRGAVRRDIRIEDFFIRYGEQDLRRGEFIEAIRIPLEGNLRCHKLTKRFDQDISAVCGCFNISVTNGQVRSARIAFGGMAEIPKRARHVEAALVGRPWQEPAVRSAAALFATDFTPISDMRASAAYRLRAAQNMLLATLHEDNEVPTRLVGRGAP